MVSRNPHHVWPVPARLGPALVVAVRTGVLQVDRHRSPAKSHPTTAEGRSDGCCGRQRDQDERVKNLTATRNPHRVKFGDGRPRDIGLQGTPWWLRERGGACGIDNVNLKQWRKGAQDPQRHRRPSSVQSTNLHADCGGRAASCTAPLRRV